MKKTIVTLMIISIITGSFIANAAEKKNIIVTTYNNVLVNATHNYAVNRQGDLVTYSFSLDGGGVVNKVNYTFTKKSGKTYSGEIEVQYIPTDSADVLIVGLENNVALMQFTNLAGTRYFMIFRLKNTLATPTPSKNDFTQKVMADNETCSLDRSKILLYTYKTAAQNDLLGITIFSHTWKAAKNKGIDFNPSHGVISPINPPLQKYYKGVIDRGGNLYDIQILKP